MTTISPRRNGINLAGGLGVPNLMARADAQTQGGAVFGYHVADPERARAEMFAKNRYGRYLAGLLE